MNITPYFHGVLSQVFKDQVVYVSIKVRDDLLKAIRSDECVQQVECSYWMYEAGEVPSAVK
jgi:hypothetical protein